MLVAHLLFSFWYETFFFSFDVFFFFSTRRLSVSTPWCYHRTKLCFKVWSSAHLTPKTMGFGFHLFVPGSIFPKSSWVRGGRIHTPKRLFLSFCSIAMEAYSCCVVWSALFFSRLKLHFSLFCIFCSRALCFLFAVIVCTDLDILAAIVSWAQETNKDVLSGDVRECISRLQLSSLTVFLFLLNTRYREA